MKMKSVMAHQFSQVPRAEIPRSQFDRSFTHKTTFDAGLLVPFLVDDILPGDTFNVRTSLFARLATPLFPIMDNMFIDVHFFFVPWRLVWDNSQKFFGAQDDPGDSIDFTIPVSTARTHSPMSLADYMGIPVGQNLSGFSLLPFRAYSLIWDEWYRDQNLQNSLGASSGDGPEDIVSGNGYGLNRRGKRHDYFTSCLPWPQKGDSVDLPLGSSAPIAAVGLSDLEEVHVLDEVGGTQLQRLNAASTFLRGGTTLAGGTADVDLVADLSEATAATINSLRQAFQIQKILERDARGGTRYTEWVRAHFGVVSPDARLQRPEFLGGGTVPVIVNPIAQTAEGGSAEVGHLAAFATATGQGIGFTKSFTEHGCLLGIVSARADLTYQQGIERQWSRSTRYDVFIPALAHIGEQAVLNKEIWADGSANDELVFGYQERFAEYRYKPSRISGVFRSDAASTLDAWHLSIDFATLPALDDTFIQENPPVDRVIAAPTEPHFIFDSRTNMICARPMPLYGVPGNMDRF